MRFFRKMGFYTKVLRSWAISTVMVHMWFDVKTGGEDSLTRRAGLVVREVHLHDCLDLFTATPSLECFRCIVSKRASMQVSKQPWTILYLDVKRFYCCVIASRLLPIDLPREDRQFDDGDKVERFNLSLYGVRDDGVNWLVACIKVLQHVRFSKGCAPSCGFARIGERDLSHFLW